MEEQIENFDTLEEITDELNKTDYKHKGEHLGSTTVFKSLLRMVEKESTKKPADK